MAHRKIVSLKISKHQEATEKRDGNVQIPIASSNQTDDQDQTTERQTTSHSLNATATADLHDTQRSVVSTESFQEQEQQEHESFQEQAQREYEEVFCESHLENTNRLTNERTSNPSPGDPITSQRTLDLVEDLLTPLQTVPMDISYETIAKACNSRVGPRPADGSVLTFSPEEQAMFDEWLVPMSPGGTIK